LSFRILSTGSQNSDILMNRFKKMLKNKEIPLKVWYN